MRRRYEIARDVWTFSSQNRHPVTWLAWGGACTRGSREAKVGRGRSCLHSRSKEIEGHGLLGQRCFKTQGPWQFMIPYCNLIVCAHLFQSRGAKCSYISCAAAIPEYLPLMRFDNETIHNLIHFLLSYEDIVCFVDSPWFSVLQQPSQPEAFAFDAIGLLSSDDLVSLVDAADHVARCIGCPCPDLLRNYWSFWMFRIDQKGWVTDHSNHMFWGGAGRPNKSRDTARLMLWRRCVALQSAGQKRRFAATFCPLLEQLGNVRSWENDFDLGHGEFLCTDLCNHQIEMRTVFGVLFLELQTTWKDACKSIRHTHNLGRSDQMHEMNKRCHKMLSCFCPSSLLPYRSFPLQLRQDIIKMRQTIEERKRVYKEGRILQELGEEPLSFTDSYTEYTILTYIHIYIYMYYNKQVCI